MAQSAKETENEPPDEQPDNEQSTDQIPQEVDVSMANEEAVPESNGADAHEEGVEIEVVEEEEDGDVEMEKELNEQLDSILPEMDDHEEKESENVGERDENGVKPLCILQSGDEEEEEVIIP